MSLNRNKQFGETPSCREADAGGYLVSWFDFWYIKETPNEKDRIRDGLSGAWQASMGALIGKWHK